MQNRPPIVLRVFQWTLWLLMLAMAIYAFAPGIVLRFTGQHVAQPAAPAADVTVQVPE